MLYDLIPMIKGKWWLIGGGMLGLCRDSDLIDWDNDLDIMILPDTEINIPKDSVYGIQDYYMDKKFYRKDLPKYKTNLWNEYIRFYSQGKKLNRSQLYKQGAESYRQDKIIPEFSEPYIDIYVIRQVQDGWVVPYWEHQVYRNEELFNPTVNRDLGFDVYIPSNTESVCRRCYGETWNKPIVDEWKKKKSQ